MDQPDQPDAGSAKAKRKATSDIEEFRGLVQNAGTVDVGKDTEYVPDGPTAREGHPNVPEGDA